MKPAFGLLHKLLYVCWLASASYRGLQPVEDVTQITWVPLLSVGSRFYLVQYVLQLHYQARRIWKLSESQDSCIFTSSGVPANRRRTIWSVNIIVTTILEAGSCCHLQIDFQPLRFYLFCSGDSFTGSSLHIYTRCNRSHRSQRLVRPSTEQRDLVLLCNFTDKSPTYIRSWISWCGIYLSDRVMRLHVGSLPPNRYPIYCLPYLRKHDRRHALTHSSCSTFASLGKFKSCCKNLCFYISYLFL